MEAGERSAAIDAHYTRPDLGAAILAGLRAQGRDPAAPSVDDLAPVDHFHTGGKAATLDLARMVPIEAGMAVLDAGGGIGGAARVLAGQMGCTVTVVDITEANCRLGEMLTARTGLGDRVTFRHGDALDLPFAPGSFDVVWTQHSTMNIADKPRLVAELTRVVRPGGRYALHEIMAGHAGPLAFPVPWAAESSLSFLLRPDEFRALLARAGWRERHWVDTTANALAFFAERLPLVDLPPDRRPPLGLHLMMGEAFGPAFRNTVTNLQEGRLAVVQAVFERP